MQAITSWFPAAASEVTGSTHYSSGSSEKVCGDLLTVP